MKRALVFSGMAFLLCGSASLAQTIDATKAANGRILASNCTQCHSTNGQSRSNGFDSLAGKSYSELKKELLEMKAKTSVGGEADEEIMIVHAKAYTADEIDLIAYYLSLR